MGIINYVLPRGTKIYSMDNDLRFVTCTYLHTLEDGRHRIMSESGWEHSISNYEFLKFSISKIMVLAEIEEKLRIKIEYIHELMRKHKTSFNPLDTADIIFILTDKNPATKRAREVFQYSLDGLYLATFPNCTSAYRSLNRPGRNKNSGRILDAARSWGKKISYGYRWSYEKFNKLPKTT